jgi:hypothetical protein
MGLTRGLRESSLRPLSVAPKQAHHESIPQPRNLMTASIPDLLQANRDEFANRPAILGDGKVPLTHANLCVFLRHIGAVLQLQTTDRCLRNADDV